MNELEKARRKIDQIILRVKAGEMTREKARKQILKLKGDGWRIAIISTVELSIEFLGIPIVVTPHIDGVQRLAQVIWQGE